MKKFLALLLGAAMTVTAFAGLTACKPDDKPKKDPCTQHVDADNDGKCDNCGTDLGPKETGDPRHEGITDPRAADAYEVHGTDGALVSAHSNLSAAIKAAVENDLDLFEDEDTKENTLGSYVVKKGSETKVFQNRKTAGDAFFYYKDNAWIGWENYATGVPNNRLNASAWTVYNVSGGVAANQSVQSYDAYDGLGQLVPSSTLDVGASRGWEVDPEYDASIKCVPVREAGAVGSKYTVDLSEVKVTPPYKGVTDKTYAFMGFYIGAGTYSDDIGIACDTATGVWYEYRMHNPTNTAGLTAEFNIGDPIMTSTWHEEGYFTPDVESLTFYITEETLEDDDGEEYWADHFTIYEGDDVENEEKKLFDFYYDDSVINESNAGSKFDNMNGFFFSAGLYIYNDGEKLSSTIGIHDYSNGSKFENLIIDSSEVYIAKETDAVYAAYEKASAIDLTLSGWNDTRTATFDGKVTNGFYNYTLVQGAPYVNYTPSNEDGNEVFSFSYAGSAVNADALAGELKRVQDNIDSLKEITSDNAFTFTDTINELGTLYAKGDAAASSLKGYIYNAVDWKPYLDSLEVYNNSVSISDAGQAIVDALDGLTNLDVNTLKGYKTAGADKKGYIFSETIDVFGQLYAQYNALGDPDRNAVAKLGGEVWARWLKLYEELTAIEYGEFGERAFTIGNLKMTGTETLTGKEIVASIFDTAAKIVFPCAFNPTRDPAKQHPDEENRFFFAGDANGVQLSFRVLYLRQLLKENGVELAYLDDLIKLMSGTDSENQYNGGGFVHDFDSFIYPVFQQVARILRGECTYLDAELAEVVNTYMVNFSFEEPNLAYNIQNSGGLTGGAYPGEMLGGNWGVYFGFAKGDKTFRTLIHDTILTIVERDSDAKATTNNGVGVDKKVTALKAAPTAITQEGTALVNAVKAIKLVDLYDLDEWKGFAPADEDDGDGEGYIYPTMLKVLGEQLEAYEDLSENDKILVKAALADTFFEDYLDLYELILKLTADGTTYEAIDPAYNTTPVHFTKLELLKNFIDGVFHVKALPDKEHGGTQTTGHVSTQGHLCCDDLLCQKNTFYTLYMEKMLKAAGLDLDYVAGLMAALKNDGPGDVNNVDKDMPNGARVILDFEYLWHVGKQLGRIAREECYYLDDELAYVVNHYMVANENEAGQYGVYETFHNGTLSYAYRIGGNGEVGGFGYTYPLFLLIDKDIYDGQLNWSNAIAPLKTILERDAGSDIMVATRNGTPNPMLVKTPVSAVVRPKQSLESVVSAFNALGLSDLGDITAWKAGSGAEKGCLQYEVGQFDTVYSLYKRLDAADQAKLKEQIPSFAEWATLSDQYNAIVSDVEKVDIPNTPDLSKTVSVFKINIANAFFNNLIGTWDNGLSHKTGNLYGYLCMEHLNHRMSSLRGLYCYYWLKDHDIQLDFADKMLELACKFEASGKSKYTNLSETECAVKDFELLRAVGKQIVRIINKDCTFLDKELADVVNEYLVAKGTYDDNTPGHFGCAESFYNLSLSDRYRNHGGDIMEEANREGNKWLYYIDATLGALNKTWAQLMSEYLIPILVRDTGDANIMVSPRNGSAPNGMVVAHEVVAVTAPKS